MADTQAASIGLICLGGLVILALLVLLVRRLWWTEVVQSRVLRWTGESGYLPYLPFREEWTPAGRGIRRGVVL